MQTESVAGSPGTGPIGYDARSPLLTADMAAASAVAREHLSFRKDIEDLIRAVALLTCADMARVRAQLENLNVRGGRPG